MALTSFSISRKPVLSFLSDYLPEKFSLPLLDKEIRINKTHPKTFCHYNTDCTLSLTAGIPIKIKFLFIHPLSLFRILTQFHLRNHCTTCAKKEAPHSHYTMDHLISKIFCISF